MKSKRDITKALDKCESIQCFGCPYYGEDLCQWKLICDVKFLKDQEWVIHLDPVFPTTICDDEDLPGQISLPWE